MKKFAVFDIDGTLVRWQLYHAVADYLLALAKKGHIDPKAYQTVRDARMSWKRRSHEESFKTYEHILVEAYDTVLGTLTAMQFDEATEAVFEEYKDQVYTYTRGLIRDLKKQGYLLFAISGSQTEIVEKIAKYYGFDDCVGSLYIRKDGAFTGEKVVRAHSKHDILADVVKKHGATFTRSIGVGDSAGDISMLEMVEQPIAFNPEKKLFMHAKEKGWDIVIERKNVVYQLRRGDGTYLLA